MNDSIVIADLEVNFKVGVPDEERSHPQRLLISLEMEQDFSGCAASDDLSQTIDYAAVCGHLKQMGRERSWKLIETLAVDVAESVLLVFRPRSVQVEVRKFILPDTRHVAVRVRRTHPGLRPETV